MRSTLSAMKHEYHEGPARFEDLATQLFRGDQSTPVRSQRNVSQKSVAAFIAQRYYAAAPMAIRFTCEVTDPETESLLRYLEDKYGSDNTTKTMVLDLAKSWLALDSPGALVRDRHEIKQLLLGADQIDICKVPLEPS